MWGFQPHMLHENIQGTSYMTERTNFTCNNFIWKSFPCMCLNTITSIRAVQQLRCQCHLYWIGHLEWRSGKCKCLPCCLQLLLGTIRFVKMFSLWCFLNKHFLWRSQGCVSFSCLFSLSTNGNIIIASKVLVVVRDLQHICNLLLIIFFFILLAKIFQKCTNSLCNSYINPTIYDITIITEHRYWHFSFIYQELICPLINLSSFMSRK